MYRFAAVPTGPWLSTVYYPRACKRYYGLMRQSDELRPASAFAKATADRWACSACSGRSLPSRAVRLTFPSLLWHTFLNHYSAQPSIAEAGLSPASMSKVEGCTEQSPPARAGGSRTGGHRLRAGCSRRGGLCFHRFRVSPLRVDRSWSLTRRLSIDAARMSGNEKAVLVSWFAEQAAQMPDAGIKSGMVSTRRLLARSPSRNSRRQFHNQSASEEDRHGTGKLTPQR